MHPFNYFSGQFSVVTAVVYRKEFVSYDAWISNNYNTL